MNIIAADVPSALIKTGILGACLAPCYEIVHRYCDMWFKRKRCPVIIQLSSASNAIDLLCTCILEHRVISVTLDIDSIVKSICIPEDANDEERKMDLVKDQGTLRMALDLFHSKLQ